MTTNNETNRVNPGREAHAPKDILRFPNCEVEFGVREEGRRGCSFDFVPNDKGGLPRLRILFPPGIPFKDYERSLVASVVKGSRRAGRSDLSGPSVGRVSESMKLLAGEATEKMLALLDLPNEDDGSIYEVIDEAYSAFAAVYNHNGDGCGPTATETDTLDRYFSSAFDFLVACRNLNGEQNQNPLQIKN